MPFSPIGGPSGSVLVGGQVYAFGKWRASLKGGQPKVNNFTSAFQQLVAGLTSAVLTMEGPYDGGNMPLAVNTTYTFTLKWTNAIILLIPAMVETIEGSQDIDDAARITVTANSTGSFTAAVV